DRRRPGDIPGCLMGSRGEPEEDVTLERARSTEVAAERRPALRARLTVVHPADLRGAFGLGDQAPTIGRQGAGAGALVIPHRTVSRAHVELRSDPQSGRHWARDLGSLNGTWLSGQVLGALLRPLEDGAVLRVGDVLAVYEVTSSGEGGGDPPEVDHAAIPGVARAIQELRVALARAAGRSSPALVIGETGTGKERIAAEIHRLSGRRGEA